MAHTPGPWTQMGDEIYGADGTRIAEAVTMRDALLLTAAPDLLASVERLLRVHYSDGIEYGGDHPAAEARRAVAKALGAA